MKDYRLRRKLRVALIATCIVAGQLSSFAAGITCDSAKIIQHIQADGLLNTLEPTYLKEPLIGSPWSRNWYVSVSAGTSAFAGTPLGCEDIFGRMQPALQVSAGKWFTPSIGVRASYQGFGMKFVDSDITKQRYHVAHVDLLWNVGMNPSDELGLHRWTVAPYIGGGIIKHEQNGKHPFTINYGVMAAYRLGHRVVVNMELAGLNTFQDFDGHGSSNKFGDRLFTLSAGLTVNIGKVGWKRAVDAYPYRQQNEYLMETINDLLRQRGLQGSSDNNSLLSKQGEYSGLASLRARLAHKNWNGKDSIAGQSSEGRKLIGVPFYFFFRINTCTLTDESQLQNLINLAKVAKAYNLNVYVDGAADAATGTVPINEKLSEQRARYIARMLREQGIAEDDIHITAKGGINKFAPIQRNRHTRVMIKSSK